MLPIHYLAKWGPSSPGVVDMLLLNHGAVADIRDNEGLTPMEMAEEGDYPERDEVIEAIMRLATPSGNDDVSAPTTPHHPEGDDLDGEEEAPEGMSLPSLPHHSTSAKDTVSTATPTRPNHGLTIDVYASSAYEDSPGASSVTSGSRLLPRTPTRMQPPVSGLGTRTTISKLVPSLNQQNLS